MTKVADLGSIMQEVLLSGRERKLKEEEANSFYNYFQHDVSQKIVEIRAEQRRAYEEGKNLILS